MIEAQDFGAPVALEGGCLAALRFTAEQAITHTHRIDRPVGPPRHLGLACRIVCTSRCAVPVGAALDIGPERVDIYGEGK